MLTRLGAEYNQKRQTNSKSCCRSCRSRRPATWTARSATPITRTTARGRILNISPLAGVKMMQAPVHLASDKNSYMSGATVVIDGAV
jgi:hypothetical protein